MKTATKALLILFGVIFLDQTLKVWIKTHMALDTEIRIFDWFIIHFTENDGMAFGLSFGGDYGKLVLSLFRIIAVVFISIYLRKLIKKQAPAAFIYSITLILGGALGNILDSSFYGVLFSESTRVTLSTFMPAEGGYAGFLYGRVVDMLYFPLYRGFLPEWMPFVGGKYFIFFQPVFNLADSAITVGVFLILIFQKSFFSKPAKKI